MTRTIEKPASMARRAPLSANATPAGFKPAALALAMAAAFSSWPIAAQAQPAGAQVIHGQAHISTQGSQTIVTTQNGAGTNYSSINWQSFSVPAGTSTYFAQPSATSTSINRVVGSDPSAIYGTLGSNGQLVLVNPAGIAVGPGAVIDTAGFTASTLFMSDADALAGRLIFGDGSGGGTLTAAGRIVARNGDVVLIAPNVQLASEAIVQAPNGAVAVAAGQKVALTGRGLEGIQLEVQAPENQVVNLGRLEGDAVGIFAGQLQHSGVINATAVSVDGGKVVLKAAQLADVRGIVTARRDNTGGDIHVTADKVILRSGATIDVSGTQGGGEALIGGGWQGQDARIANASETVMETGSSILANATEQGDGGTVVVWADNRTRVGGHIEARGGAQGGNGGKVETSGKGTLEFRATVDVSTPAGNAGWILLDPMDIVIANGTGQTGDAYLTDGIVGFGEPDSTSTITLSEQTLEGLSGNVTLQATRDVRFEDLVDDALTMLFVSNFSVEAGRNITSVDVNDRVRVAGGVNMTTTDGMINIGGIHSMGGPVTLTAGGANGNMVVREINTTPASGNGGAIVLTANGTGYMSLGGGDIDARGAGGVAGNVTIDSAAPVYVQSGKTIYADDLMIRAAGGITDGAGGSVSISAGRVSAYNAGSGDIRLNGFYDINVADLGFGFGLNNTAAGGVIEVSAGGYLNVNAPIITHGGAVSLTAGAPPPPPLATFAPTQGSLNINSAIDTTGAGTSAGANVALASNLWGGAGGQSVYIAAPITAGSAGSVTAYGSWGIDATGASISAGSISLDSNSGWVSLSGSTLDAINDVSINTSGSYSSVSLSLSTSIDAGKDIVLSADSGYVHISESWLTATGTVDISAGTLAPIAEGDAITLSNASVSGASVNIDGTTDSWGGYGVALTGVNSLNGTTDVTITGRSVYASTTTGAGIGLMSATLTGAGPLTLKGSGDYVTGVEVDAGSLISRTGDVTIQGTSNFGTGVAIAGSIDAGTGTVGITGTSANSQSVDITGTDPAGVNLIKGGKILVSATAGDLAIRGTRLEATDSIAVQAAGALDVSMSPASGLSSSFLAGTGGIALQADSGTARVSSASLSTTGAASIKGGAVSSAASGDGVYLGYTSVDAAAINVAGNTQDSWGYGVYLDGSQLRTTGTNVSVSSADAGVVMWSSLIDTQGGALSIAGGHAGYAGIGVDIEGSSSLHAGTGAVTIAGQSASREGFLMSGWPAFTIIGGDVSITATTGFGTGARALVIEGETINASSSMNLKAINGDLAIDGSDLALGSTATGSLVLEAVNANVTIGDGMDPWGMPVPTTIQNLGTGTLTIAATGTPASGTKTNITVGAGSSISSLGGTAGEVHFASDTIQLDGSVDSGTARTMFTPSTSSQAISLGGASVDEPTKLTLTQTELNNVQASVIVVGGSAYSGGLTVDSAVSVTTTSALSLIQGQGATITQAAGAALSVTQLNADAGIVALGDTNNVQVLSGRGANGFQFNNARGTNLEVGTVDGIAGIASSATGTIDLATPGTLSQTQAITGGALIANAGGSVVLQHSGNNLSQIAASASGADVSLANSNTGMTVLSGSAAGAYSYSGPGALALQTVSAGSAATGSTPGTAAVSLQAASIAGSGGTYPVSIAATSNGSVLLSATNGDIGASAAPLVVQTAGPVSASAQGAGGNIYLAAASATTLDVVNLQAAGQALLTGAGGKLNLANASTGGALTWSGFTEALLGNNSGFISAAGPITAGGDVILAGTLATGGIGGISSMTVSGNLQVMSGAMLKFDMNGSAHDSITVGGAVAFPATAGTSLVDVTASAQPPAGRYTLISGATSGTDGLPTLSGNVINGSLAFGALTLDVAAPAPAAAPLEQMIAEVESSVISFQDQWQEVQQEQPATQQEDDTLAKEDIVVSGEQCAR